MKGLDDINEKWLFHGTSSTDPCKIYDDEVGFDMRHSRAGKWGRGLYFAVHAVYSKNSFSFKNKEGTKSIFYARVALGHAVRLPSDSSLTIPPEKPENLRKKFSAERYDSVEGNTGGTDVFIVYENSRAYPDYLITFTKSSVEH